MVENSITADPNNPGSYYIKIKVKTNSKLNRIYQDGVIEDLEAIAESFTYDVSLPGDKEIKHKEYVNNNKKIYDELKKSGDPIPTNDLWIAALTLQHGTRLFTLDKHFKKVRGLFLIDHI